MSPASAQHPNGPCPEGLGEAAEGPTQVSADRTAHNRYQSGLLLSWHRQRKQQGGKSLGSSPWSSAPRLQGRPCWCVPSTSSTVCLLLQPVWCIPLQIRIYVPGGTVPPCVGLSPWSIYIYVQPLKILTQSSLEKRTIHITKELRFPHFFEGCVLRKCVCVRKCACVRACV